MMVLDILFNSRYSLMIQVSVLALIAVIGLYLWKGRHRPEKETAPVIDYAARKDRAMQMLQDPSPPVKDMASTMEPGSPLIVPPTPDLAVLQVLKDLATIKERLIALEAHNELLTRFVKLYFERMQTLPHDQDVDDRRLDHTRETASRMVI
jgi:hypothetical protein